MYLGRKGDCFPKEIIDAVSDNLGLRQSRKGEAYGEQNREGEREKRIETLVRRPAPEDAWRGKAKRVRIHFNHLDRPSVE